MPPTIAFQIHIEPARQGTYFTAPFEVPPGVERLTVHYAYPRRANNAQDVPGGQFKAREKLNTIDIGLIAPDGEMVGASGSDKMEFSVSETDATPGYRAVPIRPGTWHVLVGAYKVHAEGVTVQYEISLQPKRLRLLKGDLHSHTLASDGVHTLEELAWKAQRSGLDFVAVTDHNQFAPTASMPRLDGVTMIPGVEWTHYRGHANFLGADQPFDGTFAANTAEEMQTIFRSARERGALVMLNHPFDPDCSFQFELKRTPFDVLEVWNGPMRESNLRAVGLWQQLLTAGQRVPAVGGSDYHRDTPFVFLGGPSTCVFAESNGASDILAALRRGRAYIVFAPDGPTLELSAGEAIMGDAVRWADVKTMHIRAGGLLAGDVLRVVTADRADTVFKAPVGGEVELDYEMEAPGFARVEILCGFLPGLPLLPAALSNPIYFEAG